MFDKADLIDERALGLVSRSHLTWRSIFNCQLNLQS